MGTHNSPAYRDGIADHERRNALLSQCPPADVDTKNPGKWGGPWMYLKGWDSIADVPPHCCDRCNGKRDNGGQPDTGDSGNVEVTGDVEIWA